MDLFSIGWWILTTVSTGKPYGHLNREESEISTTCFPNEGMQNIWQKLNYLRH